MRKGAGIDYYVRDLERIRRHYLRGMGFAEVARSSPRRERESGQRSLAFRAGEGIITCSSPLDEQGPAGRYLSRHPDGIGAVTFEVEDVASAFTRLEHNGATPAGEIEWTRDERGSYGEFVITTPVGDTLFRFVERRGHAPISPGMESYDIARGAHEELGFTAIDHVTLNLRTMKPTLLWLEHVLELEPFWDVEFHTRRSGDGESGSGLRSQVMWDRASGIKLACNEPLRPGFEKSQIHLFCEDNRGEGVQHVALGTRNIVDTVRALRARGVDLMPAPPGYYRGLSEHLQNLGVDRIAEDPAALEALGILVDGSANDSYLLQIFLREGAAAFGDPQAGCFFFEIIERKGDTGFGAGNFRALFDSVEGQKLARMA
ncbi:MAG TPA: VOC family protein [Polyangiaceae bacterium]